MKSKKYTVELAEHSIRIKSDDITFYLVGDEE